MPVEVVGNLSNFERIESERNEILLVNNLTLGEGDAKVDFIFRSILQQTRIGLMYIRKLKTSPYFYIIDPTTKFDTDTQLQNICRDVLAFLYDLTEAFWFIKDNAIHPNFVVSQQDYMLASALGHSAYSNCEGLYTTTALSHQEIIDSTKFLAKIFELKTHKFLDQKATIMTMKNTVVGNNRLIDYNTTNRITRALRFLRSAREESQVFVKIGLLMPLYECLFTTSSEEITYKVSERAALYIGETPEERADIFKFLKATYGLRSKLFHGQHLENKHRTLDKQVEISKTLDSLTRRILSKAVLEDSELFVSGDIDEYFFQKIFANKEFHKSIDPEA